MRLPKMTRKLSSSAGIRLSAAAFAVLGLLLIHLSGTPISRAESIPDWLATANRVDLAHFGDGSAAVVVSQSNDFTVDETGKFIATERRAIRVLNRRSADRYLTAFGNENND